MQNYDKRISAIKNRMMAVGPMRPGSLSRQTHRAGDGARAYYQASYTFNRRSRTDYIREEDYPRVKEEVENFRRFKALFDELIAVSLEASKAKSAPRASGKGVRNA